MYRDIGYYWMRLAVYIAIAFGLGTIYFDIGHSSSNYSSIQVSFWVMLTMFKDFLITDFICLLCMYLCMFHIIIPLDQARGSMLMFVASFLTFMAIGGFPSFVEEMKVCLFYFIYLDSIITFYNIYTFCDISFNNIFLIRNLCVFEYNSILKFVFTFVIVE